MRPIPIWYDSYQRTTRAAVDTTAARMQTQDPNAEIFSLFAYKATRYKADATPNSTVVRLNRMTLLISGGLLRRFPARRSLPRRLDAGLYFLKSLFESKPVAAGGGGGGGAPAAAAPRGGGGRRRGRPGRGRPARGRAGPTRAGARGRTP